MKFLILPVFFIAISLVSCNRRIKHIQEAIQDDTSMTVVNNELNVGIIHNQKISLKVLNTGNKKRNIQPICRGIDGCVRVCEYFNKDQKAKCKQLSVNQVLSFWLNKN